ncbi:hypothetical protein CANCADRAFT_24869 [Tortispora caseinolytica NRRL Y-17796]|uniref:ABC transporter domain-containing protein n=1 Tax=Tortispora caseinolytica NRRL Y-17796 TaxID=767744 RepID=A0A1E4TH89_9ASCO|nr:hypothetical protein CANCADRAFT_24869 [Tortispora caseinolytica NRRL Y-17796]
MILRKVPHQVAGLYRRHWLGFANSWFWTIIRALALPIALALLIAYSQLFSYMPAGTYGVGSATPGPTLAEAVGSRIIVYYPSSPTPPVEEALIVSAAFQGIPSEQVVVVHSEEELVTACKQNIRGSSTCYGALQWHNIDSNLNLYNYSLRPNSGDYMIDVVNHRSDVEQNVLPLQIAVDGAILADYINPIAIGYTSYSPSQREANMRVQYLGAIDRIIAPAFITCFLGVAYHLASHMASDREEGISALLQTMGCLRFSRLFAYFTAYSTLYLPSWIGVSIIFWRLLWVNTNGAIPIIFHILVGFALVSNTLFISSFFSKNQQYSGIVVSGLMAITGVMCVVQTNVSGTSDNVLIYILSGIFPAMNYVYFVQNASRWEGGRRPINLTHTSATDDSIQSIYFFVIAACQIFAFYALASFFEYILYGRSIKYKVMPEQKNAVEFRNVIKSYTTSPILRFFSCFLYGRSKVTAVDNLCMDLYQGDIVTLIGANGSGKTTTLEILAGMQPLSSGYVTLNEPASIGFCPQADVFFHDLSTYQNLLIWANIKGVPRSSLIEELRNICKDCDLDFKLDVAVRNLSGGQKRKLQLAIMLIGNPKLCCIDEVSSGLDPVSRRKIWDILKRLHGKTSMLITTQFLDEAETLSDHIVILSNGRITAQGSPIDLKASYGGFYTVHYSDNGSRTSKSFTDIDKLGAFIRNLEFHGVKYNLESPSFETSYLSLVSGSEPSVCLPLSVSGSRKLFQAEATNSDTSLNENLDSSPQVRAFPVPTIFHQVYGMIYKRTIMLRLAWFMTFLMIALPVVVIAYFADKYDKANVLVGPSSNFSMLTQDQVTNFLNYLTTVYNFPLNESPIAERNSLISHMQLVPTYAEFLDMITTNYNKITPGGFYLDPPAIAFQLDGDNVFVDKVMNAPIIENLFANVRANGTKLIATNVKLISGPWIPTIGDILQFLMYVGIAFAAYPAILSLYPTTERLRGVRAFQYSNGMMVFPLWLGHFLFDAIPVLVIAAASTICIAAIKPDAFYDIGFLFLIFTLFGFASTAFSYVISLFVSSRISAFAVACVFQAVALIIFLVAHLCVFTYAPGSSIDNYVKILSFTLTVLSPSCSLLRAFFVSLNVFGMRCTLSRGSDRGGDIMVYGQQILYLIVQLVIYVLILLLWETKTLRFVSFSRFKKPAKDAEKFQEGFGVPEEVAKVEQDFNDIQMGVKKRNGLRLLHLYKKFRKNLAVDDVTFSLSPNEVLGLVGPNGAGKTTTIEMIRGELKPSSGFIFFDGMSCASNISLIRQSIGVCPQFNAIDSLNVLQSLNYYCIVKGVPKSYREAEIASILQTVQLEKFSSRMVSELSGGNKRRLSLGIALMGKPELLLLDEPSSGMDPFAKRNMWHVLQGISKSQGILLTTHSMEEAEAVCSRVAVMAQRVLGIGAIDELKDSIGKWVHIEGVLNSAPNSCEREAFAIMEWIKLNLGMDVQMDDITDDHRYVKSPVMPSEDSLLTITDKLSVSWGSEGAKHSVHSKSGSSTAANTIDDGCWSGNFKFSVRIESLGELLSKMAAFKESIGAKVLTVAPISLEEVFLKMVGYSKTVRSQ